MTEQVNPEDVIKGLKAQLFDLKEKLEKTEQNAELMLQFFIEKSGIGETDQKFEDINQLLVAIADRFEVASEE